MTRRLKLTRRDLQLRIQIQLKMRIRPEKVEILIHLARTIVIMMTVMEKIGKGAGCPKKQ